FATNTVIPVRGSRTIGLIDWYYGVGTYRLTIGPYIAGRDSLLWMNQNNNALDGEDPGDVYSVTLGVGTTSAEIRRFLDYLTDVRLGTRELIRLPPQGPGDPRNPPDPVPERRLSPVVPEQRPVLPVGSLQRRLGTDLLFAQAASALFVDPLFSIPGM